MKKRWSKEAEFAEALANGTTDGQRLASPGNWQETLNDVARLETELATKDAEIARLRCAVVAHEAQLAAREMGLPDEIDLFRIIRRAGRSDRAKALAVHSAIEAGAYRS